MKPPRKVQFVARESYRMRRLMDAARFLPIFGFVLVLLPLMRTSTDTEVPPTAVESTYLFIVWFCLVLVAFVMSLGLRRALDPPKQAQPPLPQRRNGGTDPETQRDDVL